MNKKLLIGGAAATLIAVAACTPPPGQVSPKPPVALPVCVDAGPLTPNVLDLRWQYPQQPVFNQTPGGCLPETSTMQINLWISLAEGQTIAHLLCVSKGGVTSGPIPAEAVWLICMDVDRPKIGLPA